MFDAADAPIVSSISVVAIVAIFRCSSRIQWCVVDEQAIKGHL